MAGRALAAPLLGSGAACPWRVVRRLAVGAPDALGVLVPVLHNALQAANPLVQLALDLAWLALFLASSGMVYLEPAQRREAIVVARGALAAGLWWRRVRVPGEL